MGESCGYRRGLLTCDRPKGHEGSSAHRDNWILPEPVDFETRPTVETRPKRRPISQTGIYIHRHAHIWNEAGTHEWPSGAQEPVWKCEICGDTLVCPPAPQVMTKRTPKERMEK